MLPWLNHFQSTVIQALGYLVFALTILGIFYAFHKHLPYKLPFLVSLFICFFFLINENFPTKPLYSYISNHIPLLSQAFRSIFTKWSIAATLFLSFFFASGCLFLYNSLLKLSKKFSSFILVFSIGFVLVLLNLPIFQG